MSTKNDVAARRKAPLATPSDLSTESIKEISGSLNPLSGRIRTLSEDEELSLAHERPTLPRLPSSA
jgi:hypothetical protein